MPALNEANSLAALLTQLQQARAQGHEVILVDGGSADDTPAVAAALVDSVIVTPKPGRALQMNSGARAAVGDYLWFVHADSVIPGSAVAQLQALPAGVWGRFDVRLSGPGWPFRMIAWCMNARSRISGIATGDQGIFVCAKLFRYVGGYPQQPLMEDVELSRRLRAVRRPLCLTDRIQTSSRRWEQNGICRTILLMWRLRALYFLGASPARLAALYHGK